MSPHTLRPAHPRTPAPPHPRSCLPHSRTHALTHSGGFTLIEIIGVLVVTAVIATGVWSVTESVTRGQVRGMEDADRASAVASLDAVLRNAVQQATRGTLSAPNAGPVHVRVAGGAGAAMDTLVVLRGEGPAMTLSTRTCPGGGACLYLFGSATGRAREGDVLLVSVPGRGARVYRVVGEAQAERAACGADCEERLACASQAPRAVQVVRVTESTLYPPSGAPYTVPAPCRQAYDAERGRCVERRSAETVSVAQQQCSARGAVATYTRVPVADVTAALGFPDPGDVPQQGGAALTPRVQAQRVLPSRFFVRRDAARAQPLLVRQTGMDPDGAWNRAVPVGGPVSALEVQTLHAGETAWRRGVGVDAADLAHDPSNPNYARADAPGGAPVPGFAFRRGYHSVGAVRVRFTVPTPLADGTAAPVPYVVVVATNGATRGGSGGGW